jgi:AraC-like DNA-binding protein
LERDFAAHHDAGHYAAALGLDPDRLAGILTRLLGKTTKRVIDERLVLEAKRALRYTDRPLKEIAAALGYGDQFHLSKTFKRLAGASPQAFRQLPGK